MKGVNLHAHAIDRLMELTADRFAPAPLDVELERELERSRQHRERASKKFPPLTVAQAKASRRRGKARAVAGMSHRRTNDWLFK